MAKKIERGKFLLIECTAGELMAVVCSDFVVCDHCDKQCLPSEEGVYIAALNQWFCKECFEEWVRESLWYPEDAEIEQRNFDFYAPRFGLKCQ